jgi:tryptophan synthase alpha chain
LPKHSTTNISSKFQELRSHDQGALVAYLTGGDPEPKVFLNNVAALAEGGADIVEIGIPFSDPIADGPVIQSSSQRSLAAGTTPKTVMDECRAISEIYPEIPLVILSYYNPIIAMGLDPFMQRAREVGVSGTVVPDLPVEESSDYRAAAANNGIDTIFLAAPNTSEPRLANIIHKSSGFLYLVSLFGVTGARDSLSELALSSIKHVKNLSAGLPTAAGFGISRPDQVSALIRSGADGAIVGSALVKLVTENLGDPERIAEALRIKTMELKKATKKN